MPTPSEATGGVDFRALTPGRWREAGRPRRRDLFLRSSHQSADPRILGSRPCQVDSVERQRLPLEARIRDGGFIVERQPSLDRHGTIRHFRRDPVLGVRTVTKGPWSDRVALNTPDLARTCTPCSLRRCRGSGQGLPGPDFARHMPPWTLPTTPGCVGRSSSAILPMRRVEGLRTTSRAIVDDLLDSLATGPDAPKIWSPNSPSRSRSR